MNSKVFPLTVVGLLLIGLVSIISAIMGVTTHTTVWVRDVEPTEVNMVLRGNPSYRVWVDNIQDVTIDGQKFLKVEYVTRLVERDRLNKYLQDTGLKEVKRVEGSTR